MTLQQDSSEPGAAGERRSADPAALLSLLKRHEVYRRTYLPADRGGTYELRLKELADAIQALVDGGHS